jgi:hypothetical protein
LGLVAANGAQGAVNVLSDNFDSYVSGTNLSGQGGWTATLAAATPIQVAGTGNLYAQLGLSGQDEYKALSTVVNHNDGDSIETSFKVNVASATATGDYFLHLSNPAGTTTNFYQRIFAKSSDVGYVLGLVDTSGTGTLPTFGTSVLGFNTSHTVDVLWNFVAGSTNNDTFVMLVDGAPYLTHTWTSATVEPTAIAAVNLRQGGGTTSASVQVDDINVSSIAAAPEPATMGVVAAALGALCLGRRSRRE